MHGKLPSGPSVMSLLTLHQELFLQKNEERNQLETILKTGGEKLEMTHKGNTFKECFY